MAKAYTKAAKRAAKKAKQGMPKLEGVPRRKKRGTPRMAEILLENLDSVLKARAKQVGSKDLDAMRSQMLGEGAGQALHLSLDPDTAKRLWEHYAALTAAEARYHRSLGMGVHAKTAKIEFMPESFEVRDDITPDLRTPDERDAAAARAWQYWKDQIAAIGLSHGAAIYSARQGFADMVLDAEVTPAGRRFVAAMVVLDERM